MRVSVAVVVFSCGCSSAVAPVNHHNGAGTSFPPSSTTVYHAASGKPSGVQPGQQVGYGLTVLAPGSFRILWTGDASAAATGYREFWGSVWTTGHFTSITPGCGNAACPLELDQGDFVSGIQDVNGGQRIDWDTIASTGFDGFDFTTDAEPIYVDPYVDGAHQASLVFFPSATTKAIATPTDLPFAITSK